MGNFHELINGSYQLSYQPLLRRAGLDYYCKSDANINTWSSMLDAWNGKGSLTQGGLADTIS